MQKILERGAGKRKKSKKILSEKSQVIFLYVLETRRPTLFILLASCSLGALDDLSPSSIVILLRDSSGLLIASWGTFCDPVMTVTTLLLLKSKCNQCYLQLTHCSLLVPGITAGGATSAHIVFMIKIQEIRVRNVYRRWLELGPCNLRAFSRAFNNDLNLWNHLD